jgi:hypothetical protein
VEWPLIGVAVKNACVCGGGGVGSVTACGQLGTRGAVGRWTWLCGVGRVAGAQIEVTGCPADGCGIPAFPTAFPFLQQTLNRTFFR